MQNSTDIIESSSEFIYSSPKPRPAEIDNQDHEFIISAICYDELCCMLEINTNSLDELKFTMVYK